MDREIMIALIVLAVTVGWLINNWIRAKMKDVDRRLAEVEHFYVSSNPRLTAEIERLR